VPWNNSSLTEPVYLERPAITIMAADETAEQPVAPTLAEKTAEPAPPAVSEADLANNVAKLIAAAFEKPEPVPIGVGAVAVLANFPRLRGEEGVRVELAKAPASGVFYLSSEPLTDGSIVTPVNLTQVTYQPSIGSEANQIP